MVKDTRQNRQQRVAVEYNGEVTDLDGLGEENVNNVSDETDFIRFKDYPLSAAGLVSQHFLQNATAHDLANGRAVRYPNGAIVGAKHPLTRDKIDSDQMQVIMGDDTTDLQDRMLFKQEKKLLVAEVEDAFIRDDHVKFEELLQTLTEYYGIDASEFIFDGNNNIYGALFKRHALKCWHVMLKTNGNPLFMEWVIDVCEYDFVETLAEAGSEVIKALLGNLKVRIAQPELYEAGEAPPEFVIMEPWREESWSPGEEPWRSNLYECKEVARDNQAFRCLQWLSENLD